MSALVYSPSCFNPSLKPHAILRSIGVFAGRVLASVTPTKTDICMT